MECFPVAPTRPGERAVLLPWFWPDATSFHTLTDTPTALRWSAVRADPGLLFFLLARDVPISASLSCRLSAADLRAAAARLSEPDVPWVSWSHPALTPVLRTVVSAAHFAEQIAAATGVVDSARAWTGAWLAYAGWLAVGVADPTAVTACLSDPTFAEDPFETQVRAWGMTRADVAWRLSATWAMPRWARAVLGRLDAAPDAVAQFSGDRHLQAVVQTAVVLAEQVQPRLFAADEFDLAAALGELRLTSDDLDRIREVYAAEVDLDAWLTRAWDDPRTSSTLPDRLASSALELAAGIEPADDPPLPLVELESDRVQSAKLAAVAEFAAGASHEINNPLAVISGQSEYLLRQVTDCSERQALESIVRQTRRIHAILTELMYFARPPVPQPETIELGGLVRDAVADLSPFAAERDVEIRVGGRNGPLWIEADPKQLSIALSALIRNGVEAAPAGGWVRVTSTFRPDRLDVVVEDNGPGPDGSTLAHLFDPFFSGRSAGRGRGLGLPAAWRLAREHGGDVRYVPVAGGPTRFVLTLPAAAVAIVAQRKTG
jgi:signal transduction histidine kinase